MTSTSFGATKTVTVNGTTLAYREQGEGEPVVFVHGGISDLRTWEQQLPTVGRSYRAITYSRRYARPNADLARDAMRTWLGSSASSIPSFGPRRRTSPSPRLGRTARSSGVAGVRR